MLTLIDSAQSSVLDPPKDGPDIRNALLAEQDRLILRARALSQAASAINQEQRTVRDLLSAIQGAMEAYKVSPPLPPAPETVGPMPCDEWRGAWVTERWTRERIDILARDWPTERCPEAILADVNALPGPTVELSEMGGLAGAKMKLTRPPGCKERWKDERRRRRALAVDPVALPQIEPPAPAANEPPVQEPAPDPAPEPRAEPVTPAPPPPAPVPERVNGFGAHRAKRWTPERVAILQRDWITLRLSDDILAEINESEGGNITSHDMALFASEVLGIRRPADYRTHWALARKGPAEDLQQATVPQPKRRMEALMQVSRSIGTPASPPTKGGLPITRDGTISFAALQEKADGQPDAAVVTWKTAMDWATDNKVRLGGTENEDLAATNAARRKWCLPVFVVRGH